MDSLSEHVVGAIRQLRKGDTIGRRRTPVISFWPMRDKWKKHGEYWHYFGTDGDTLTEGGYLVVPATLRLVFFRTTAKVCLLAYVVTPEDKFRPGSEDITRMNQYDSARGSIPEYD